MTITVNMHVGEKDKLQTSSRFVGNELGKGFLTVDLILGVEKVTLFMHKIEDVDALAFEFETLARLMREAHGWEPKKEETA